MNTQPTALRLADELEMWTMGEPAAVELRRLHTENVELREAIKRAIRIEQAQPVAWMCSDASLIQRGGYSRFSRNCEGAWNIPVYTAPPQRKPLTDEEIIGIGKDARAVEGLHILPITFARAIEAAHGIGEKHD